MNLFVFLRFNECEADSWQNYEVEVEVEEEEPQILRQITTQTQAQQSNTSRMTTTAIVAREMKFPSTGSTVEKVGINVGCVVPSTTWLPIDHDFVLRFSIGIFVDKVVVILDLD